jgi:predicted small integral membrane protein
VLLCWAATVRLVIALKQSTVAFRTACITAVAAVTLGMLLWFVAFLSIGGEWFLMWQSHSWNGQDAAFRMFTMLGIILLFLSQPETVSEK